MPSALDLVLNPLEEEEQAPTPAPQAQRTGRSPLDLVTMPLPPELRASTGPRSMMPEPDVPTPSMMETYGRPAGAMALRMGGPIVGSIVGGPIGGALGGAGGEAAARYVEGKPQALLPTVVGAVGGALMPAKGLPMGEMAAREALIGGGMMGASRAAEGEIPSGKELLLGAILGGAGGAAMSKLEPRVSDVPIPQRGDIELPRPFQEPELPQTVAGPQLPREQVGALPRFEEEMPLPMVPDLPPSAAGPPRPEARPPGGAQAGEPQLPRPDIEMPVTGEKWPTPYQAREEVPPVTPADGAPDVTVLPLRPGEEAALSSPIRDALEHEREVVGAEPVPAAGRNGQRTLSEILASERGGGAQAAVAALARGGVGAAVGATQGETPEERIRNAVLGGVGLAAASPALGRALRSRAAAAPARLGEMFQRGRTKSLPPASPVDELVAKIGQEARKVEYHRELYDFAEANRVADAANAEIERLIARAQEVTPNNRLFRVVTDEFVQPGEGQARNLAKVTGSAQLMQRYSALSQRLQREAQAGNTESQKAARVLFGNDGRGVFRQTMDFWRGNLVTPIRTQVRNMADLGSVLTTGMMDKFYTGTIEGIRTGKPLKGVQDAYDLGRVAAGRTWNKAGETFHVMGKEPDKIQAVLDHYPDIRRRLLEKPEGMTGPVGEKLTRYLETVNTLGTMQEELGRKIGFEGQLRVELRRAGIDAEQALRNPAMIPDSLLERALNQGLSDTMANTPKSQGGKTLLRLFSEWPVMYAGSPYPKYIANRMKYIIDHNPFSIARLVTQGRKRAGLQRVIDENEEILNNYKALGKETAPEAEKAAENIAGAQFKQSQLDTPAEIWGKYLTTWTMIAAGAAFNDSSVAGEHWYKPKAAPGSKERIDIRPFGTMAGYAFMGALANQARKMAQGKPFDMPKEDVVQGIALLGMRSGIGLTVFDLLGGRSQASLDSLVNTAADLFGTFGSGFLQPVGQLKDIAGMYDPKYNVMRETRDTPAMRVWGPVVNQIPGLREKYLPTAPSATSTKPRTVERPLAHFLGVNVETPNIIEKELARLGIPYTSVRPTESNKIDQRILTAAQGRVLGPEGAAAVLSPEYQALSKPEKRLALKQIISSARKEGLGSLPPETIERILRRRQPADVQEILRQQGR